MSLETMTKLASVTVGAGGSNTVTFSNIPQGYTDLKVIMSARTSGSNGNRDYAIFRINGDTVTNYNRMWSYSFDNNATGTGKNTTETVGNVITLPDATVSSLFSANEITFYNYSGNTLKTVVAETNASTASSSAYILAHSSTNWQSSAPITSISFTAALNGDTSYLTGTFGQYSTFNLYGIKNAAKTAGNSIKATGGNIVFDGTYVYHVFPSTSAFVPTQPILADALVIGGGGGGGYDNGGGGGAGGVAWYSSQSLTAQSYTCTIGAGGAGSTAINAKGSTGGTTTFAGLTAKVGGGGGGSFSSLPGASGASSGGGSGESASGASGSATDGFAGAASNGTFVSNGIYNAGGGGGAGAAAIQPGSSSAVGGSGGLGTSLHSSLLNAIGFGVNGLIAGGGGGATLLNSSSGSATGGVGSGGGGNGGGGNTTTNFTNATNGLVSSGSGGGGGSRNSSGTFASGSGGSGVVIIRYKG
jgi:hypothetical protein